MLWGRLSLLLCSAPHLFIHRVDEQRLIGVWAGQQVGVRAGGGIEQLPENDAVQHCTCLQQTVTTALLWTKLASRRYSS